MKGIGTAGITMNLTTPLISCYRVIVTATISHKSKNSFKGDLLIVIFKYHNFTILESQSLELITREIAINVVNGGFWGEGLK